MLHNLVSLLDDTLLGSFLMSEVCMLKLPIISLQRTERPHRVYCNQNGTIPIQGRSEVPTCIGDWSSCRDACLHSGKSCFSFGFNSVGPYAYRYGLEGGDCSFYTRGPQKLGLRKSKMSSTGFYNRQCFIPLTCTPTPPDEPAAPTDPACDGVDTFFFGGRGVARAAGSRRGSILSIGDADVCTAAASCNDQCVDENSCTNSVLSYIERTEGNNEWQCELFDDGENDTTLFTEEASSPGGTITDVYGFNLALPPPSVHSCSGLEGAYTGFKVKPNMSPQSSLVLPYAAFCTAAQACLGVCTEASGCFTGVLYDDARGAYRCELYGYSLGSGSFVSDPNGYGEVLAASPP